MNEWVGGSADSMKNLFTQDLINKVERRDREIAGGRGISVKRLARLNEELRRHRKNAQTKTSKNKVQARSKKKEAA